MPLNFSPDEIQNHSLSSMEAKASRRLLFQHCNTPLNESGVYHSDWTFGGGSGILLNIAGSFFILTALHVLVNNNIDLQNLQNESSIWTHINSSSHTNTFQDYLYAKYAWNISELIEEESWDYIDLSDVILIELFPPLPSRQPDSYIEITPSIQNILLKEQIFEGQLLSMNGYPIDLNTYDYETSHIEYTHTSQLHRRNIFGIHQRQNNGWSILPCDRGELRSNELNGMSGGNLCNIDIPNNKIKWAGMILSGNHNCIHYIPAYILYPALFRYSQSTRTVIDPSAYIHGHS